MTSGRAIDHVGIAAHSLDALAAQYEALGFRLTPRAQHPDHMGTSNRLVQFAGKSFLELIEVDRPDGVTALGPGMMSFGAYTLDFLRRRTGINLVVFRTDDRDADLARWRAAGLITYEPFNFERLATLPDGTQQTVRFELGFVTHPDIDVLFFVCDNKVEEHFWKPEFQVHENGTQNIASVVFVAEDPSAHAPFLAALFHGDIRPCMDGMSIQCASQNLKICTPRTLAARGWTGSPPPSGTACPVGLILEAPKAKTKFTPAEDAGGTFIQWMT